MYSTKKCSIVFGALFWKIFGNSCFEMLAFTSPLRSPLSDLEIVEPHKVALGLTMISLAQSS